MPRMAATMSSTTVRPTMPMISVATAVLFTRVVSPGRRDDQRRLEGQHDEGLQRRARRRVGLADQRLERDLDQAVVDRHRDDGQERERRPAEPPAHVRAGQPRRPLVGEPGQRDAGRQRAVQQGDERLADDDDQPGPDGPGAAGREGERVGGEDAGGDRDERERDGERLEMVQRAGELLAVAESAELSVLGRRRGDLIHGYRVSLGRKGVNGVAAAVSLASVPQAAVAGQGGARAACRSLRRRARRRPRLRPCCCRRW